TLPHMRMHCGLPSYPIDCLMCAIGPKRTFYCVAFDVASGVKRTWALAVHMSAFDPKRTLIASRAPFPSAGFWISFAGKAGKAIHSQMRASHFIWTVLSPFRQKNQVALSWSMIDAISHYYRSKSGHWLGVCAAISR